jgi:hypothetical protein
MENSQEFQQVTINGTRLVARRFFLEALVKAHEELVKLKIGANGKLGFIPGPERTASWRSEKLQRQILNSGASKTMLSNHRRGVAVDCFANWAYIKAIKSTMNKYGLVNDLAYVSKDWKQMDDSLDKETPIPWDGGHWNFKSNRDCYAYPMVDSLPNLIKDFSMQEFDNHVLQLTEVGVPDSGSFALVYKGQKHLVTKDRKGDAALTILMRAMVPSPVNKAQWDSIPTGDNF